MLNGTDVVLDVEDVESGIFIIGVEDGGSSDVVSDRGGSDVMQDDLDDGSGTFLVTCCLLVRLSHC